jgi:hypothetical protein
MPEAAMEEPSSRTSVNPAASLVAMLALLKMRVIPENKLILLSLFIIVNKKLSAPGLSCDTQ